MSHCKDGTSIALVVPPGGMAVTLSPIKSFVEVTKSGVSLISTSVIDSHHSRRISNSSTHTVQSAQVMITLQPHILGSGTFMVLNQKLIVSGFSTFYIIKHSPEVQQLMTLVESCTAEHVNQ